MSVVSCTLIGLLTLNTFVSKNFPFIPFLNIVQLHSNMLGEYIPLMLIKLKGTHGNCTYFFYLWVNIMEGLLHKLESWLCTWTCQISDPWHSVFLHYILYIIGWNLIVPVLRNLDSLCILANMRFFPISECWKSLKEYVSLGTL